MTSHPGLAGGPIYLDYNATTPVDPRVAAAIQPSLIAHFGNPSNTHHYATTAAATLHTARTQVAALIGATPDAIVFTGSGSEANNLAIRGTALAGLAERPAGRRPHVITQATEHPAVLATCAALQRLHHAQVTYLPTDSHGLVNPDDLTAAITPDTVLVTVMLANNETGTLQPIAELTRIAHAHGIPVHTDAAQAVAKIPVDVNALDVDLLTLVGHKMYAPKGIAALYVRPDHRLEPVIYGGGHEHGLRAGTENVPYTLALGIAADLARTELNTGSPARLAELRDRLHHTLTDRLPVPVHLNGHPHHRLPTTLNISLTGIRADHLLAAIPQLAASTGSACHTGTPEPSPVLTAMHLDHHRTLSALRLSIGRWTTPHDIDHAADLLTTAARQHLQNATQG